MKTTREINAFRKQLKALELNTEQIIQANKEMLKIIRELIKVSAKNKLIKH